MARATSHYRRIIGVFLAAGLLAACSRAPETASPESAAAAPPSAASEQAAQEECCESVAVLAGSMVPGRADGDALTAQFIKPYGICAGTDGALILADSYSNQLREISDGRVTTVAGLAVVSGDGQCPTGGYRNGDAGQALLNRPRFVDHSRDGVIIFSDSENNMLRACKDGRIYPLAGAPESGYADGDAKTARFNLPSGVAIGGDGAIYVADTLNNCIRVISPEGQVRTLAGDTEPGLRDGTLNAARFREPNDIAFGPDGALYVVDKGNQRIRKIYKGMVSTVAGSGQEADQTTGYILGGYRDGPADSAQFLYPTGLCVAEDTIYIADTGNNCIRALTPEGTVSTVAGSRTAGNVVGTPDEARFNQPLDVLWMDGLLYVTDSYNHIVKAIALQNTGDGEEGAS